MPSGPPIKVRQRDTGLKRLLADLRQIGKANVGIFGTRANSTHKNSRETVGEIATKHEFGLGVPKRSWLRDGLTEAAPQLATFSKRIGEQILRGKISKLDATKQFGLYAAGQLRKRMAAGIPPPNSPYTIRRKGSSTPLIDTGQMRAAISSELVPGIGARVGSALGMAGASLGKFAKRVKGEPKLAARGLSRTPKKAARSLTRSVKRKARR